MRAASAALHRQLAPFLSFARPGKLSGVVSSSDSECASMRQLRQKLGSLFKNWFAAPSRRPASRPRRCRLTLEPLERRDVPTVTYHGGPLLRNVEVEDVFLGSSWSSNTSITPAAIDQFMQQLSSTSY